VVYATTTALLPHFTAVALAHDAVELEADSFEAGEGIEGGEDE
jgi:hypothetical protein